MIVNINTFTEADFVKAFAYRVSLTDQTPIDISGYEMRLHVRKKTSSAAALIESSTANGMITINDHTNGLFTLRIPYNELNVLSEGDYSQSLVALLPSGILKQIWYGAMTHRIGATRWPTNPASLLVPQPA